jgi:hypothetical protein
VLTIEATGDRARAEGWFKKYGTIPAQLQAALRFESSVLKPVVRTDRR